MRLQILESGHSYEQKLAFQRMLERGGRVSDMTRLLAYRPAFFGMAFSAFVDATQHQPSAEWTQGERELFAAFVSRLNQCVY
ncbi:MAG TPA: hypothetical protein VH599_17035 [Ktedonobacterales bacterium]|jgi:hypothetical protein